jgi:hypothetical protein
MSGIPTTGAVSMSALKTEFSAGAAAGNSLSGYRGKTIYDSSTNAATTIAGTGAISFSTFRGKRALVPPVATANTPTISGGVLTYSWSAINSPATYTVNFYRTTTNTLGLGTLLVTLTDTALTSSTYTPTQYTYYYPAGGPIYRFTVTATNAAGTSPLVQSSDATYNPPVSTAAVSIAGGVLTYSWSAINTPTSFTVSLTDTTTNTIVAGPTSYTTAGSATYSPLTNEHTYVCSVTATNSQGTGPENTAQKLYSVAAPIANTPTISGGVLSYFSVGIVLTGQTIISTEIKLYNGNNILLATNGGRGSYTPVAGQSYYITARLTTNVGTSLPATSGTVTYNPPATPTGVAINIYHGNANGGILVSWTAVSGATSYSVTDGTTTITPTTNSTILPLKNDGSKQLITVSAVNAQATSAASASTGVSYFPGNSSYYTWVGVGSCTVTLAGAGGSGQAPANGSSGSTGGSGGLISGTFSSGSSTWYIIAGKTGTPAILFAGTGGYGGGGNAVGAGNGGGGCSCISASSTTPLITMYLCAGGGGGSYGSTNGTSSDTGNSTQNGTGANGTTSLGGGGGGYFGGLAGKGGGNYTANFTGPTTTIAGGGKSNQDGYVIITWGSVTPTLFNPNTLSTLMSVWFDASDSSTVTGTTSVTAWKSKGCYHANKFATNRNGTTSYITANQNNLNIIRCPADVDMSFSLSSANQARAWFIVAKNTTQQVITSGKYTQYWVVVNQTQGNGQDSPSGPNFITGTNTASIYTMAIGPSGNAYVGLNTGPNCPNPYNVWNCYSWVNSATSTANNYIGINKTSINRTLLDTVASSYRTDTVTYSINTSVYSTGSDIGEIIMYNGEITSTERDNVIAYLMTKWGIT